MENKRWKTTQAKLVENKGWKTKWKKNLNTYLQVK
jgi:hypothetical protein